tara:strand:- start:2180 stop:5008 length:2829 start_codon:yes stop_codon:yes gene_type:complete
MEVVMKNVEFNDFFTSFSTGVISLYSHLSRKGANELESCGLYRCGVALGFDILAGHIKRQKSMFTTNKYGVWCNRFQSFQEQVEILGVDVAYYSKDEGLRLAAEEFLEDITLVLMGKLIPSDFLGRAIEVMYGLLPIRNEAGEFIVQSTQERRVAGVYYTPSNMVKLLVEYSLENILTNANSVDDLLSLKIVDPAVGPGLFLVECTRKISAKICELNPMITLIESKRLVVENCIYGVDSDPLVIKVAQVVLFAEAEGDASLLKHLSKKIKVGDSLLGLSIRGIKSGKYDGLLNGFEGKLKKSLCNESLTSFNNIHKKYILSLIDDVSLPEVEEYQGVFKPFCWEYEFPDVYSSGRTGFDVVVSNPPWGKIKPNIKEFYSHLSPDVKNYQGDNLKNYISDSGQSSLWGSYISKTKIYSRILAKSGIYTCQSITIEGKATRGDPDLYKYFMEKIFDISSSKARLGLIVPSSFIVTEGAAGIRKLYLENGTFEKLYDFQNKKRLFKIHPMFRFLILSYEKSLRRGILSARFGLSELPNNVDTEGGIVLSGKGVKLSYKFLRDVSRGILNVPDVRSDKEKKLFHKLYKLHPCIGEKEGALWNVKFVRELDMTNDSSYFVRADELKLNQLNLASTGKDFNHQGQIYRPLLEGKMLHQFDYSAKGYVSGQGRTAVWKPLGYDNKKVLSHYYVPEDFIKAKRPEALYPRAGFCDVTGHANERTVLAAIVPGNIVCGNKVPTCRFSVDDPRLHLIWVAIANSFVVDWIIRRKISTTINFFHWDQIPFPRVDPDSSIGKLLAENCAKLSLIDSRQEKYVAWLKDVAGPVELKECRDIIRARIDACVAKIYGLSLDEFSIILDDFPLLDRKQPNIDSERASITKDIAKLFYYNVCEGKDPKDITLSTLFVGGQVEDLLVRVKAAKDVGATGYVPSELTREIEKLRAVNLIVQ